MADIIYSVLPECKDPDYRKLAEDVRQHAIKRLALLDSKESCSRETFDDLCVVSRHFCRLIYAVGFLEGKKEESEWFLEEMEKSPHPWPGEDKENKDKD